MNRVESSHSAVTPFFDNRHSKSTTNFPQGPIIIDFSQEAKKKQREGFKYRHIHKKYSQNQIDTLDNVLARTLQQIDEAHSQPKIQKSPTASGCLSKNMNIKPNRHSKSIKSFKDSLHTFSSQERYEGSLSLKKRIINEEQLQRVAGVLQNLCNKSVKSKFELKNKHSITEWIDRVHEVEQRSKNELYRAAVNQSKLVLWTESKIIKTAEGIYEQIVNFCRKLRCSQKDRDLQDYFEDLSAIIKELFMKKYKTQKLMKENLANLIYSLQIHLTKREESKDIPQSIELLNQRSYLNLFEEILNLKYETEDVLFFLFSRKIIEKNQINAEKMSISINERSSRQFFKILTQNDQQLIRQYELELRKTFKRKLNLDLYSFLALMIKNYSLKRRKLKSKGCESKNVFVQTKGKKQTRPQLAFINYDYDQTFWKLQSQNFMLEPIIKAEIEYQSKKLISILCNSLPIEYKTFIKELLAIKSLQIVNALQRYDRRSVLSELGFFQRHDSQSEKSSCLKCLEDVRNQYQVVLSYVNNKKLDPKTAERFTKKLLTLPFLSNKLYELIEYFEGLMERA